jgi:predicted dehydrogenase
MLVRIQIWSRPVVVEGGLCKNDLQISARRGRSSLQHYLLYGGLGQANMKLEAVRIVIALQSGAVASVHLKGGTSNGTRFLLEIHGTEGVLAIVPADPRQATYTQVSDFTVHGAQADKPLADLSIPESYRWVPPAVPAGLPFNVAQLYTRMAEGIREGKARQPRL